MKQSDSHDTALPTHVLLGVRVNPLTIDDLNRLVMQIIADDAKEIIANHNTHSAYLYHRDAKIRQFYNAARYTYIDSMPLLLLGWLSGLALKRRQRVTNVDWQPIMMRKAADEQWRVFFVGARPGVAETAARVFRAHAPGDRSPGSIENEAVLAQINAYQPHILLVGMGMPLQEHWLIDMFDRIDANVLMNVGAIMDYFAGEIPTPPRWMGRVGLEWLYRLGSEPRRLWQRYLVEPWLLLWMCYRNRHRINDNVP
jgi:N-acetylglucosaminyldiphosphoundecaprenol N-acetyl-beta-D-mannosaminyltransferase